MAAPAYTPVATNPFAGGFPSTENATVAASSAASFGIGYLQKLREERFSSLRPMSEFFDRNRFSMPGGFSSVTSRFNYNLNYFQGNYLLMFLAITAYSLITNFTLMFSVAFVVGGMYFISKIPPEGVVIGSNTFQAGQLKTGLICIAVVLFFFSSTIGTVFWIVGASAVTILGHAAVMQEGVEGEFVSVV
ncbi:hypothetical protein BG011_009499 [Mortierella polycephala]|uniref:PRA1 family protein n=1 Tax=Mortierella polycephala TaxID=41804 RepID=A0A9P6TVP7_9FUNG|nr:hypothetical protein BG011_009499 [Mortierella polycephala]